MGSKKRGLADPRGKLCDMKAAIGGVVIEKGLMVDFSGMGWGIVSHSSGDSVNEHLAPLDIGAGREGSGCW